MIKGIGIDIIEIERIKTVHSKFTSRFVEKILTESEQKLMDNKNYYEYLAGRFAAKEAVAKSLGKGIGKVGWHDIEILADESGKPYVNLYRLARRCADTMSVTQIFVSISHSKTNVVAQAILVDEQ